MSGTEGATIRVDEVLDIYSGMSDGAETRLALLRVLDGLPVECDYDQVLTAIDKVPGLEDLHARLLNIQLSVMREVQEEMRSQVTALEGREAALEARLEAREHFVEAPIDSIENAETDLLFSGFAGDYRAAGFAIDVIPPACKATLARVFSELDSFMTDEDGSYIDRSVDEIVSHFKELDVCPLTKDRHGALVADLGQYELPNNAGAVVVEFYVVSAGARAPMFIHPSFDDSLPARHMVALKGNMLYRNNLSDDGALLNLAPGSDILRIPSGAIDSFAVQKDVFVGASIRRVALGDPVNAYADFDDDEDDEPEDVASRFESFLRNWVGQMKALDKGIEAHMTEDVFENLGEILDLILDMNNSDIVRRNRCSADLISNVAKILSVALRDFEFIEDEREGFNVQLYEFELKSGFRVSVDLHLLPVTDSLVLNSGEEEGRWIASSVFTCAGSLEYTSPNGLEVLNANAPAFTFMADGHNRVLEQHSSEWMGITISVFDRNDELDF